MKSSGFWLQFSVLVICIACINPTGVGLITFYNQNYHIPNQYKTVEKLP